MYNCVYIYMYCTLLTWATQQRRKLGQARVEVLLRQQALKPKANSDGVKLTGTAGKSILGSKSDNPKMRCAERNRHGTS